MANSVGQVILDLILNNNQFNTQINSMQHMVDRATNSISNAFAGVGRMIASAFSIAVVTAFTKECIEASASVKALNSQFEQTFGSMQSNAEQAIQSVANESGIVESRLQGVGTSIYAFAKTTGMDSANALTMMQEALQVTADSAAYYDRSLEETAESLKSFLKGNYENDDALGLSCTEITRNTAANKLYGKSFQDLSESQKQLTLLQMVKDANKLSGAMGQASREADGWENVTGNLKEAWKQFLAVVGQPILQVATQVVKKLSSALQTLTTYAKQATSAISEFFGWDTDNATASAISSASDSASSLADSTDSSTESLEEAEKAAKKLKNRLSGFDELNVLSDTSSDESNTEETSPVQTDNVQDANNALTDTEKLLDDISSKLKKISKELGFDELAKNVQKGLSSVNWEAIKNNVDSIFADLKPIAEANFNGVKKIAKSSMGTIGKYIGGIISVSGKQLQTVTGGIAKWLNDNKAKISAGITEISSNISGGIDNVGNFYNSIFGTLGDSIDRMRPTMENAIATLLSGFSNFGLSVGTILSGAFNIATDEITKWAINNQTTIGTFFDNIQGTFAQIAEFFGGIMTDISEILTGWWYSDGAGVFSEICRAFTDIGTTLLNVYNKWIQPVIDTVISIFTSFWENTLKPIFEQVVSVVGKIGECLSTLWNNILSPLINLIIDALAPKIENALNTIKSVFDTVFTFIGNVVSGFLKYIGGMIDFITGIFQGDWDKAWQGIQDSIDGVWQMIWGTIKGIINLIIDGINGLWTGIYSAVKGIVDSIGSVAGALGSLFGQDWSFTMPAEPPLIPKLAKGGIIKAPTLALVGDNADAGTGNPEVVAPLNKLKGMLNESDGSAEDTAILSQILQYMVKIYELMLNSGSDIYEFIAELDGDVIFKKMVEVNSKYKKRHGGRSAFA